MATVADMARKLLPVSTGIALILGLGCATAQAIPTDDPTVIRLLGVNELTMGGASAAEFVEGRPMPSNRFNHAISGAATLMENREADYYRQDSLFEFLLVGIGALAGAGFALTNKAFGNRNSPEVVRLKECRENVFEADLRNMDNMMQGPLRRSPRPSRCREARAYAHSAIVTQISNKNAA